MESAFRVGEYFRAKWALLETELDEAATFEQIRSIEEVM
jgi:hypothetical protein